jgi:TRAP-type mannitol/chloroaromatic compound transport system permease small subunit
VRADLLRHQRRNATASRFQHLLERVARVQWYLFSAMFLLGASHTLKMNEHVRVDIVYANVSRVSALDRPLGAIIFLLPAAR